jgi:hypothetical protein
MAISVKSAKQKGRKLQQVVRDKIIELLYYHGVTQHDVKSTSMGQGGEDVQLSPLARTFLPISVECKSHKSFAVYKPYEQAKKAAMDYQPLLVIKGDHKSPLAIVDLDYYFYLEECRIFKEGNK